MMNALISRRHFLGTVGATAAAAGGLKELLGSEPAKDNIRLGMMLQGGSAADLQEKAKAIADLNKVLEISKNSDYRQEAETQLKALGVSAGSAPAGPTVSPAQVKFPVEAKGPGACRLVANSTNGVMIAISGEGFEPNEQIATTSQSDGEVMRLPQRASAE